MRHLQMKLYEAGPSRSARVRWILQELGVSFEAIPVDLRSGEQRKPEFLAINPAGKVPVIDDGGFVLNESAAIMLYLAEAHPDKGLIPTDLHQRAEMYRWMFFCVTELEQPIWRITRHKMIYPEDKRLAGDISLAQEEFQAMAAMLEKHMQGRQFLTGDRVSVADFLMAYTLDWATMFAMLEGCGELNSYLERMYARPGAPLRMAAAFAARS